jgi:hypothetical protein
MEKTMLFKMKDKIKIRVGALAQVIEYLPSKHKVPSSNPNTAKQNKRHVYRNRNGSLGTKILPMSI